MQNTQNMTNQTADGMDPLSNFFRASFLSQSCLLVDPGFKYKDQNMDLSQFPFQKSFLSWPIRVTGVFFADVYFEMTEISNGEK